MRESESEREQEDRAEVKRSRRGWIDRYCSKEHPLVKWLSQMLRVHLVFPAAQVSIPTDCAVPGLASVSPTRVVSIMFMFMTIIVIGFVSPVVLVQKSIKRFCGEHLLIIGLCHCVCTKRQLTGNNTLFASHPPFLRTYL